MTDPIALGSAMVESLDAGDRVRLHVLVPEHFWDWLDDYLDSGWTAIDELVGEPREVIASRLVDAETARLTLRGPRGDAFVTARFDEHDRIKGFAFHGDEFEGIGTIVVTCPPERVTELADFYAALVGRDARRRPRLHFDEGNDYRPPRWPDPRHPQQMHLDFHVRDLDASHELVVERGASLLADQGDFRIFADPIGHPFCLYPEGTDELWRVVIDGPDPVELSHFYRELLGPDPVPSLAFQEAPGHVAPRWPDPAFPAQMHFDIKVDDRAPVQARLERLGAPALARQGGSCPVYADPAGHPFCICLHGE